MWPPVRPSPVVCCSSVELEQLNIEPQLVDSEQIGVYSQMLLNIVHNKGSFYNIVW